MIRKSKPTDYSDLIKVGDTVKIVDLDTCKDIEIVSVSCGESLGFSTEYTDKLTRKARVFVTDPVNYKMHTFKVYDIQFDEGVPLYLLESLGNKFSSLFTKSFLVKTGVKTIQI